MVRSASAPAPQTAPARVARDVSQVEKAVAAWDGVETRPGQFDSIAFHLGRRELGHLHADGIADLPFPRRIHDELIADGRARRHAYLPDSGWVTTSVAGPGGPDGVIALFTLSYERAQRAARRRGD